MRQRRTERRGGGGEGQDLVEPRRPQSSWDFILSVMEFTEKS